MIAQILVYGTLKGAILAFIAVGFSLPGILQVKFGDKFRCATVLKQMVRAGHFGMKTGRDFFTYEKDGRA